MRSQPEACCDGAARQPTVCERGNQSQAEKDAALKGPVAITRVEQPVQTDHAEAAYRHGAGEEDPRRECGVRHRKEQNRVSRLLLFGRLGVPETWQAWRGIVEWLAIGRGIGNTFANPVVAHWAPLTSARPTSARIRPCPLTASAD